MDDASLTAAIAALSQELAIARRRIAHGEVADLSALPARMQSLFAGVQPSTAAGAKNALLSLMAECDSLVGDLEAVHSKLGHELRTGRDRRKAFQAYKSPVRS